MNFSDEKNKLLSAAIIFAAKTHAKQVRKGTDIPYITHLIKVIVCLMEMKADNELLCAGLLHDTVEDAGVKIEDIEEQFGKRVAELVGSHSEDKSLSWKTRKEIDLADIAKGTKDLQKLVLADKLANFSDTLEDYRRIGDAVWQRFNAGKEDQKWYYRENVKALASLKDDPDSVEQYNVLCEIVKELFC